MANSSLKIDDLDKNPLQNVVVSFNTVLLKPLELQLGDHLLQNPSLKLLEKSTFEPFSFRIEKKSQFSKKFKR